MPTTLACLGPDGKPIATGGEEGMKFDASASVSCLDPYEKSRPLLKSVGFVFIVIAVVAFIITVVRRKK